MRLSRGNDLDQMHFVYTRRCKFLNALAGGGRGLTITLRFAFRTDSKKRFKRPVAVFVLMLAAGLQTAHGQVPSSNRDGSSGRVSPRSVRTAAIHWLDVPLRDAISRLEKLFGQSTFLDRRIDPTVRVNFTRAVSSSEQALSRVAAEHDWSVRPVGDVVYLGPADAGSQLGGVIATRKADVAKLPPSQRSIFTRKRTLNWPRLAKPRALMTELVEKNGWRVEKAERIPHDLWSAGELNGLTLTEQLAVLLIGFDLTYEIRSASSTIEIVQLDTTTLDAQAEEPPNRPRVTSSQPSKANTKQVYSLRVTVKPVGAVMRELARRLNWEIEFDEAAIQAAGRSLDARVSFAVENVEQDELLDAVLQPAGLTFQRNGEVIRVVPRSKEREKGRVGEGETR
jgi:hypothetical protein